MHYAPLVKSLAKINHSDYQYLWDLWNCTIYSRLTRLLDRHSLNKEEESSCNNLVHRYNTTKYNIKYKLNLTKQRGMEITPVLPIARQKFPWYFKGLWESSVVFPNFLSEYFFLVLYCSLCFLFLYSTISRGNPDNGLQKPPGNLIWEALRMHLYCTFVKLLMLCYSVFIKTLYTASFL